MVLGRSLEKNYFWFQNRDKAINCFFELNPKLLMKPVWLNHLAIPAGIQNKIKNHEFSI